MIPKDVLVLPDPHLPVEDKLTLKAVEKLLKAYNWSEVVCLGDLMDFNCISSHNKDNLRAISGQTIWADYAYANKVLDRWQNLAPKAKFTLLEGNHDYRVERYIDANPQLQGMIEVPVGLHLKERGINWVPYWSKGTTYKIGHATFIHGRYTNEFHAKKHVSKFGTNLFYGHTHDVQEYSLELLGNDKTLAGRSCGTLCDYNQKYMRGAPNKWQQAILTLHFFEDGYFEPNLIKIFKHRFYYNGKTFKP